MAVVEHGFQPQADRSRQGSEQKPNPDYDDMTKLGHGHLPVRGRRRDLDVP